MVGDLLKHNFSIEPNKKNSGFRYNGDITLRKKQRLNIKMILNQKTFYESMKISECQSLTVPNLT